jgi:hypothetical protein
MMEASRDEDGGMRSDVSDLRKAVGIEQVESKETASARARPGARRAPRASPCGRSDRPGRVR